MDSLTELLQDQIKDLFHAEKQLTKALPAMARKASNPNLKQAFTSHLDETNNHVTRLEEIADKLEFSPKGKVCKAMEGLIAEGKEVISEKGDQMVLDAALIAAAQRVEHYEISAYGSARALAEQLGHEEIVDLLQETLDEESAADSKLNTISLEEILPEATTGSAEEEETGEEDEESVKPVSATPARSGKRRQSAA